MNSGQAVVGSRATQDLLRGILLLGALALFGVALATLPLSGSAGIVLGAVVILLVLARPVCGLLLLVLAIPFGSPLNVQIGGFNLGPTEVLFALTLASWLGRKVVEREDAENSTHRVGIPGIVWPLAFLLFGFGLTLTVTHSMPESLKELVKWFEVLALVLFIAGSLRREHVLWLLALMFVAAAGESAIGVYQTYTGNGPEPFLVPLGSQIIMRSYGTFEQPNPFAAYLNFSLPIIVSLGIGFMFEPWAKGSDGTDRGPGRWLLLTSAVAVPFVSAAFFFSLSRGAWLGFAIAFIAIVTFRSRRAFVVFGAVLLVLLAGLILGSLNVLPAALGERLADIPTFLGLNLFDPRAVVLTDENFALVDRMAHWYAAWNMFVDHPWLGVGIGNYGVVYAQYGLREWPFSLGHAHNIYLNMLAETGIIGATLYVIFVLCSLGYAWLAIRRTRGLSRALSFGILGALIAIAAHNFFDNLYVHGMNMQMAVLLGALAVLKRGSQPVDTDFQVEG